MQENELNSIFDCGCKRPKFEVMNYEVKCQKCYKSFNKLEPELKKLRQKIHLQDELFRSMTKYLIKYSGDGNIEYYRTKIRELLDSKNEPKEIKTVKAQAIENMLSWALAVIPDLECRNDEDCDHCHGLSLLHDLANEDLIDIGHLSSNK